MKKIYWLLSLSTIVSTGFAQADDAVFIKKIADEIFTHSKAYDNLRVLTKTIGPRLAGSPQMYKAEEWGYKLLQATGSDTTYKQACMVPRWVRGGQDKATAILPGNKKRILDIVALGNSFGTGKIPLAARVVLINNFDEMEAKKDNIKGHIVFYNYKFNPRFVETFYAYGDAVKYRGSQGTAMASQYGAVATIVRSMSHETGNNPHTGSTWYKDGYKKNPAVAIGLQDADWLAQQLEQGVAVKIQLSTHGYFLPDVEGHNIIGELKGTKFPDEYITVGGHLDSWDNCEGAHDDGAGITQTIEILRTFKALKYQPKRTIRFVLFANEENGSRGGKKYAEEAEAKKEKHIFALESDAGGFTPRGFHFDVDSSVFNKINQWAVLLAPYSGGHFVNDGEGGVDIGYLKKLGTHLSGLAPDSQRYFDIHHSRADTFESVNKRELELGAINMAALIYLVDKYGLQ
ncbi:MAG: M20/M25/M40 family metallo-hydrolase [Niabella sp.]